MITSVNLHDNNTGHYLITAYANDDRAGVKGAVKVLVSKNLKSPEVAEIWQKLLQLIEQQQD